MIEYSDVFSREDFDLGTFSEIHHHIDTGTAKPVRQPARRTPLRFQGEEDEHLEKLLQAGVVKPSKSEWASPVVLVRKKDGGVRWCVDYRKLNDLTVKDAYPLPKIDECLDTLSGATMFSTLDLMCGYHQVEVKEADRSKTAFVTKHGLFEYTRMPFGLCNAPSTFQRAMELVLRGLQWSILLIYLDDVIITGKSFKEHMTNLQEVLQRFRKYGIKLKAKKCKLLQKQVVFLGHVVSASGIHTNPKLVADVQHWKAPRSLKELQAFLGLTNYYRRFIRGYANIAAPLNKLTRKQVPFSWGTEQANAFEQLKQTLTEAPVLAYPISEGRFILDTDASNLTIGAVLSQEQEGEEKVISFASRRLGPSQERYCVTRRELLAVVSFCNQFKHYLLGRHFLIRTDHSSLAWLFRFKSPQGQLARWLEELSQYSFTIEHRAGKAHGNADALSRKPDDCDCYNAGYNARELPCKGCKHCATVEKSWEKFNNDVDYVVPLATRRITTSETNEQLRSNWLEQIPPADMAVSQTEDDDLKMVKHWLEYGAPTVDDIRSESPSVRAYFLNWQQFKLIKGVLYYEWVDDSGERSLRLLVPRKFRRRVIQSCHEPSYSGHQGEKRTLDRVRKNFYWYGLTVDVLHYVAACAVCGAEKRSCKRQKAPLQSYLCGAPLDRLHIDFLGPFPTSSIGNKYILIITDQFTKWVEAYALPDQSAETTAKCLVEEFIARFGAPLEIHSDQGRNFQSELFHDICKLLEVTQTRTTPYHPASNGQVERFNRTLLQMIRCYIDQGQRHWDKHIPLLMAAYRSTPHQTTGLTPNLLMLGREVHQPHDIQFKDTTTINPGTDVWSYLDRLRETMDRTQKYARKFLKASQIKQKKIYDLRILSKQYEVGDLVYVSNLARKVGKSPKLQPVWNGPYVVTKKLGPVLYQLQHKQKTTVLHHDRLKPYLSEFIPHWVNRSRGNINESSLDPLTDVEEGEEANENPTEESTFGDVATVVKGPQRTLTDTKFAKMSSEQDNISSEETMPQTDASTEGPLRTRSGRQVKPRDRLDL